MNSAVQASHVHFTISLATAEAGTRKYQSVHFPAAALQPTGGSENVYRECTPSGTWRTVENSTDVWRDKSECLNPHFFKPQVTRHKRRHRGQRTDL
ncbi:hypothetical protein AAFF_G00082470 [Aldrovandia affinis]|uniref:Uncharacterized protein n=1 Tax=Aldrovandia affinis TaxID=143900 RepID=A0AAD7T3Y0_9TELE|nr:hypothetical protein AAFF_G00082470 [Aldrovandia affinis]